jgi:hypothetical protein
VGIVLLVSGCAVAIGALVWSMLSSAVLANRGLFRIARRNVQTRLRRWVEPSAADSLFIEVVPFANRHRLMLETASDVGFLTVNQQRREILFEGDKERYRIPAQAIGACDLKKCTLVKHAAPNAPGIYFVVLRISRPTAVLDVPITPRLIAGRVTTESRRKAAEQLRAHILAILPRPAAVIDN